MDFNLPVSPSKLQRLLELLALEPSASVLDVGCGRGEFAIRLLETYRETVLTGIDVDIAAIDHANQQAETRLPDKNVEFRVESAGNVDFPDNGYDLTICLGSTHAFAEGEAAFPTAIKQLASWTRPGGQILIGEGYWKAAPAAEYLEHIGDPVGVYRAHAENVTLAQESGLTPLFALTSNDDEWDDFEWSHQIALERSNADAEKLERGRRWRKGYLRWGRDTMGFGFYLFRKP